MLSEFNGIFYPGVKCNSAFYPCSLRENVKPHKQRHLSHVCPNGLTKKENDYIIGLFMLFCICIFSFPDGLRFVHRKTHSDYLDNFLNIKTWNFSTQIIVQFVEHNQTYRKVNFALFSNFNF